MRAAGFGLATVAVVPLFALPAQAADVRVGVGITVGANDPRYGSPYGYGYGRRPVETYRYGFDRGRAEGARDGYHDGSRGRRFELYREGDYRDADKGYKGWMGARYEYARGYQRGFEQGYRQTFEQGRRYSREYDRSRRDDRYDRNDRYGREGYDGDDEVIYENPRRW
jgi:hypothetical protein